MFEASKRVRQTMQELGRDPRHFGLIHSDTHPGNMLIHGDEIAVLDCSDCGFGHYAFALGVMLFDLKVLCQLAATPEPYSILRTSVLAGYSDVFPLPVTEESQLEAFNALRCLASLRWIARSPDLQVRGDALNSRPGVPIIFRELERFVTTVGS